MRFGHEADIWADFPALVAGVLRVVGIDTGQPVDPAPYVAAARERRGDQPESELPEIQAWRRAFTTMGLSPTKYRSAAEALLRRLRTRGDLPTVSPLVDLCNAVSAAFAIPVAVFDVARVGGDLVVRRATGDERYLAFSGEIEHPMPGEVIFADDEGFAHARGWTNRQSARSAIQPQTTDLLVVCEALHDCAAADVAALVDTLAGLLGGLGTPRVTATILSADDRWFES